MFEDFSPFLCAERVRTGKHRLVQTVVGPSFTAAGHRSRWYPPTMSATPTTQEPYQCRHCGGPREAAASVGGSFCSERCLYRHRGEKALREIADDHCWCATCFRQVKETTRPDDRELQDAGVSKLVRRSFIGFQDPTEHAVEGVDDEDRGNPHRPTEYTRISCECGAVDPTDRHDVLRDLDPKATMQSLWACLVALERNGTLQHRPSKDAYIEALREHNTDWLYATGRALYAD